MSEIDNKQRGYLPNARNVRSRIIGLLEYTPPLVHTTLAGGFGRKRISAMMRIKNEEKFLRDSVESVLPLVDEVVIIDNDSTDNTPLIAQDLAQLYRRQIRVFHYADAIARVGSENQELASTRSGRRSPRLLANYYNWCLRQCRMSYILKWDGDMVATPNLAVHIEHFRNSSDLVMKIFGANLHPDRYHLVGASADTQQEIQTRMETPMSVENWTAPYTDLEPRLFPRVLARYRTDFWWCESLDTPWMPWSISPEDCGFIHLKYCKPDPYENWSPDFSAVIQSGIVPGPVVPDELHSLVTSIGTSF
jgi:Glycosyl transferase family 2